MTIVQELIYALADIVNLLFTIYTFIVIGRVLISWVNPDPYNPIVRFLHSATDPVLFRIRRLIPLQFGGIDFSPLVLLLALSFLQRMIKVMLHQLAIGL